MTNQKKCDIISLLLREVTKNNIIFAVIAQLVEHILGKDEVISSTLINSSTKPLMRFIGGFVLIEYY